MPHHMSLASLGFPDIQGVVVAAALSHVPSLFQPDQAPLTFTMMTKPRVLLLASIVAVAQASAFATSSKTSVMTSGSLAAPTKHPLVASSP